MRRPKSKEKRKYRRVEARIKVAFQTREKLEIEYTKNISKGGMFLKTDRLLDPNAEIDLTMTFPEGMGEYRMRGVVTRLMSMSDPERPGQQLHGVGVRFLNPETDLLEAIERILDREPASAPAPS